MEQFFGILIVIAEEMLKVIRCFWFTTKGSECLESTNQNLVFGGAEVMRDIISF